MTDAQIRQRKLAYIARQRVIYTAIAGGADSLREFNIWPHSAAELQERFAQLDEMERRLAAREVV